MFELTSNAPEDTREIGRDLGRLLQPGDIICLYGQLGAGKTALAQGVALGLGIEGPVTSPTFILINEYQGRLPLYHFDVCCKLYINVFISIILGKCRRSNFYGCSKNRE